ncbi:hypothetical protein ACFYPG_06470 [Micromonospora sp. NPDC005553]|uniref:hypothetical protein n=1 Tax=Micromonospora sp. NPDC005553 TaxID=3364232 RepID=UPI0036AEAC7A
MTVAPRRRRTGIDAGIAELVALLTGRQDSTAEQVCDLLLSHFGNTTEDDIVLAVVHACPDDGAPLVIVNSSTGPTPAGPGR